MPKVLVVDDSLSVRKVVQRALESKRIEVLSAASGNEAMEQIAREAPDLIVCDVIMPDMDGYQICDFVKKHPTLGHTPVLLISGIVNSTVLERAAKVRPRHVAHGGVVHHGPGASRLVGADRRNGQVARPAGDRRRRGIHVLTGGHSEHRGNRGGAADESNACHGPLLMPDAPAHGGPY